MASTGCEPAQTTSGESRCHANQKPTPSPREQLPARKSMWDHFKDEFRWENFSLSFEKNSEYQRKDPKEVLKYFHSSLWPCCNRLVYLVYRIGIAVYYTIWLIESIVRNHEFRTNNYIFSSRNGTSLFLMHPWPFYMTSWSLTALFLHLWIAAFLVLYFYSINEKSCLANSFTYFFSLTSASKLHCTSSECSANNHMLIINAPESPHLDAASGKPAQPGAAVDPASLMSSGEGKLSRKRKSQASGTLKCFNCNCMSSKSMSKVVNESDCCLVKLPDKLNRDFVLREASIQEGERFLKSDETVENGYGANESDPSSNSQAWSAWMDAHVPPSVLVLIKISWLLYNLIAIAAIVVTIGYFSYVYIADLDMQHTWSMELGNLHRHGFNSIVAIIDILLMAYPVRIFHNIYTNIYGWIYALVIFLYWLTDPEKNIIYELIDYKKPARLILMYTSMTLMTVVLQTIHFLVYQLKLYVRNRLYNLYLNNKPEFCTTTKTSNFDIQMDSFEERPNVTVRGDKKKSSANDIV